MSMLAPLLLLVLGVAVVVGLVVTMSAQNRLSAAEQAELARLRTLVEDLKELAWDHRELDPDLSTIVIDTIRSSERRGRDGGPHELP